MAWYNFWLQDKKEPPSQVEEPRVAELAAKPPIDTSFQLPTAYAELRHAKNMEDLTKLLSIINGSGKYARTGSQPVVLQKWLMELYIQKDKLGPKKEAMIKATYEIETGIETYERILTKYKDTLLVKLKQILGDDVQLVKFSGDIDQIASYLEAIPKILTSDYNGEYNEYTKSITDFTREFTRRLLSPVTGLFYIDPRFIKEFDTLQILARCRGSCSLKEKLKDFQWVINRIK